MTADVCVAADTGRKAAPDTVVNADEEGILIAAMVEDLEDAGGAVLTINVATELVEGIGIGK